MDKNQFVYALGVLKSDYPDAFICITIYDNPSDDLGNFVARAFLGETATTIAFKAKTLDEVQYAIPQDHFVYTTRQPQDDPIIVGVWL